MGIKSTRAMLLLLLGFTSASPALGSMLWDWTFTGATVVASGTFTTVDTPNVSGFYLITAISGTRNGETITGLQPAGTAIPGNAPYVVDNLVRIGPDQLTSEGFGFSTAQGNYSNPFYAGFLSPPTYLEVFSTPSAAPGMMVTELPIAFTAVPVSLAEPGSAALLAVALTALMVSTSARRPRTDHGADRSID
jgi:hypothetical protein